ENMIFFNNLNLKNLTIAVVQLGLYDRYCRRQPAPKFLIGDVANDAPVRVAANIQTLREMITSSRACSLTRPLSPVRIAMDEGLIGQRLPSYRVFKRKSSEEYEALKT